MAGKSAVSRSRGSGTISGGETVTWCGQPVAIVDRSKHSTGLAVLGSLGFGQMLMLVRVQCLHMLAVGSGQWAVDKGGGEASPSLASVKVVQLCICVNVAVSRCCAGCIMA